MILLRVGATGVVGVGGDGDRFLGSGDVMCEHGLPKGPGRDTRAPSVCYGPMTFSAKTQGAPQLTGG
jgi:hypothetical protein